MRRATAATLAACTILQVVTPAARAHAQAAEPFRVIPLEAPLRRSHTWAYVTLLTGASLVGLSFTFAQRADDAYASYLVSTDTRELEILYDRAVRNDHISQGTLLTGEAMIAVGLYLRFVRRPSAGRLSLSVLPTRCAVSCRF